jgi:hypothetical protein
MDALDALDALDAFGDGCICVEVVLDCVELCIYVFVSILIKNIM